MADFFNKNNSNNESIAGAIQKAGTTYNTLKNMNLKQSILGQGGLVNGFLGQGGRDTGANTGDDSIPNNESPPSAA